jgi:hypothetical protein
MKYMWPVARNKDVVFVAFIECVAGYVGAGVNNKNLFACGGHSLRECSAGKSGANDNPVRSWHGVGPDRTSSM